MNFIRKLYSPTFTLLQSFYVLVLQLRKSLKEEESIFSPALFWIEFFYIFFNTKFMGEMRYSVCCTNIQIRLSWKPVFQVIFFVCFFFFFNLSTKIKRHPMSPTRNSEYATKAECIVILLQHKLKSYIFLFFFKPVASCWKLRASLFL